MKEQNLSDGEAVHVTAIPQTVPVESRRIDDYKEENEKIPIGSIVATYAHPFCSSTTDIIITNYAGFTPPLMVVIEKKYGPKYNSVTGMDEDNDSYKCFYYSTTSGVIEENWFRRSELKFIEKGDLKFFLDNRENSMDKLKRDFIGKMAILSTVDFEMKKQKMWSDSTEGVIKMKKNNLLDFLPPLGVIIDFKLNDDYQKYSEKDRKISYRKSKILVKLRWMNNTTSKYSEGYFPMVAIKLIIKDELTPKIDDNKSLYRIFENISLEGTRQILRSTPLQFHDIIWKHYYYEYRFKDLFTQNLRTFKLKELGGVIKIVDGEPKNIELILKDESFEYNGILNFFSEDNKQNFENKWLEIQYSDKNERYTKRIIYIQELMTEKLDIVPNNEKFIIKANCLLRNGFIRHFNVARIRAYRILDVKFSTFFVN